ncbi:DNA-binding protein [Pseudomonas aeruginosa]|nr:DNA-binding protein [Pseudomonas aeruginosa]HBN8615555.1 DNA-binding protein [Pseudomonas aeruginosa]HBO3332283.1 DNA-binding protein [Pseudomonas aeruginosa]
MSTSADRARLLIKQIGPKKVSLHGGDYERWKSVSKGAIRVSTEEIDVLVKIYPQYALWLASGNTAPEIGQTSPDYEDAAAKLAKPSAG